MNGIDCVALGTFAGFASGAPCSQVGTAPAPAFVGGSRFSARSRPAARPCSRPATTPTTAPPTSRSPHPARVRTRPRRPRPPVRAAAGRRADTDPPQTKIKKAPKGKIDADTVKVKFKSDEPNSSFECKFDRKPYKPCQSPKKLKNLDDGKHKFKVRATDAAGNTDDSPAKAKFKVVD